MQNAFVAADAETLREGAITQPIDQAARGFYARWGFQDLPFDPRGATIVRTIDLERSLGDGPA
jgi:hypothetical protein